MSRCIFCQEALDHTAGATNDKIPSEEHIVPNALGGSRNCSTVDVCKGCNSSLGDTVDAALINHPLVAMLRHRFKTPGYSGVVPDLVLAARSMDSGEPGRVIFRPDAKVDVQHTPTVVRDKKPEHEEVLVAGHPQDVERILKGILTKAHLGASPEQKAAALSALEEAIANATPEVNELYKIPIEIDLEAIYRGLIKIAFTFAHRVFGWQWTASSDVTPLRNVARGFGAEADVKGLVKGIGIGFRNLLPISATAASDHHVLAFLPTGSESLVMVSLFGEELLTVAVKIEADLDKLCEQMTPQSDIVVSIDPRTRQATWISLLEYSRHTAALFGQRLS